MMKKIGLVLCGLLLISGLFAQEVEKKIVELYHPTDDAQMKIDEAVIQAKKEGKHVLLQLGGNWCGWCIKFDDKVKSNDTLKTAMDDNFVVYHLNYSQENLNEDILADLGYPQRFGFPVFVILDGDGKRLHTQSSSYLEEGKGHDKDKVLGFFNDWSPAALDPERYKMKK